MRCKWSASLKLNLQTRVVFFTYRVKSFFFLQLSFISLVHYLMLFQLGNLDVVSFLVFSASGWINFVSNADI